MGRDPGRHGKRLATSGQMVMAAHNPRDRSRFAVRFAVGFTRSGRVLVRVRGALTVIYQSSHRYAVGVAVPVAMGGGQCSSSTR